MVTSVNQNYGFQHDAFRDRVHKLVELQQPSPGSIGPFEDVVGIRALLYGKDIQIQRGNTAHYHEPKHHYNIALPPIAYLQVLIDFSVGDLSILAPNIGHRMWSFCF